MKTKAHSEISVPQKSIALYVVVAFMLSWGLVPRVAAQRLPALIPYTDGHKWGYADTDGKVIIKLIWEYATFFEGGRARVLAGDIRCTIDEQGEYIIPPYRNWTGKLYPSIANSHYNTVNEKGKWGLIDSNNKELRPCRYDGPRESQSLSVGGYFIWDRRQQQYTAKAYMEGKCGIVDTNDRVLIPFEYDDIGNHNYVENVNPKLLQRYYQVTVKETGTGIVDAHNRIVIPLIYKSIDIDEAHNQFRLYKKDNTTVIADSSGHIKATIPGYIMGLPANGLIPVADSTGKWGLMNEAHKLLLPCQYRSMHFRQDTLFVSQQRPDSAGIDQYYYTHLSARTLKQISPWLTSEQYGSAFHNFPTPPVAAKKWPPQPLERNLGYDTSGYQIDNIIWSSKDYPKFPEHLIPVTGMLVGDTLVRYAAILDTNGKYVMGPVQTTNRFKVINPADSLILLQTNNLDSAYSVTDYHLNPILSPQQHDIAAAFYYKGVFYAITAHDKPSWDFFRSPSGEIIKYISHNYTYYLTDKLGNPAKGMASYKICSYVDSAGYLSSPFYFWDWNRKDYAAYKAPFKGFFRVADSLGKTGIVNIKGQVLFPSVSFKYDGLTREGPHVFLVADRIPAEEARVTNPRAEIRVFSWKDTLKPPPHPKGALRRGFPYLVNEKNRVLGDSVSVEQVIRVAEPEAAVLYNLTIRQDSQDYPRLEVGYFYMDDKGRAYHAALQGAKKSGNGKPMKKGTLNRKR